MTKGIIKTEDSRIVTVGTLKKVLKEERGITLQELLRLEGKVIENNGVTLQELCRLEGKVDKGFSEIDEKFVTEARFEKHMIAIADSINQIQEVSHNIQRIVESTDNRLAAIQEEHNEFRQRTAQLERMDFVNERKIDDLDARVLKLEVAL